MIPTGLAFHRLQRLALLISLALAAPVASLADCDSQAPSLIAPACTACGGPGQRACCNGDGEIATSGLQCNTGLVPLTTGNAYTCSDGIITSETTNQMCVQPTACGGDGQRACCVGESSNGACNSGLTQISGCYDGVCVCSNLTTSSSDTSCVQMKACGGPGQRACCIGTLEYSNNGGTCNSISVPGPNNTFTEVQLTEVPGCAGDCTCGGPTALGENSTTSCTIIEPISEPTTNSSTTGPNEARPPGTWTFTPVVPTYAGGDLECAPSGVCGFADLHVHMFANLGSGGAMLGGEAWDPNGINAALAQCFGSTLKLTSAVGVKETGGTLEPPVDGTIGFTQCPSYLLTSFLGNNLCANEVTFHGNHSAFDSVVGGGSNDGAGSNLGAPAFNGWPLWTSTIHQQVYWKWLERAWQGGMRLMVMHAVSNETFCKGNPSVSGTDCSNAMSFIDPQLSAAVAFQGWLDSQYGSPGGQGWSNGACQMSDPNCYATQTGSPGPSWFQIVTTPQQATAVIQQGKLAVVLGIEVDNLFNCHYVTPGSVAGTGSLNGEGPGCTAPYVLQQLQKYYNMGVRHIFPVHDFDNAFASTATWEDALNIGNYVEEGALWQAQDCPTTFEGSYGFGLSSGLESFEALLGFGVFPGSDYSFFSATCHAIPGLTSLGQYLVQQAMQMGMILDVDHMSINAFNDTISMAQGNGGYSGIMAGHVLFFDLYQQTYIPGSRFGRHERMRTLAQVQTIKSLGGMISLITKDDIQDTGNGYCPAGNCPFGASSGAGLEVTVNNPPNYCRYSTTEWAQSYLYGVNAMGGPVAIGSDFNGVAGHLGPRFGSEACGGSSAERIAQGTNRLAYPFSIGSFGTFSNQVTGQRTFDYNVDGLAHIGLIPDMIADLQNVGVSQGQLQPLFGSAQAYITMWTNAQPPPTPPAITSPNSATFIVGTASSFTASATGLPVPTFSETGALPGGVTLASNGTLAGTPATTGIYPITIIASNGGLPNAMQPFTLTVDQVPAISSANAATFYAGVMGSFQVVASGFPAPTYSESGTLPNGVTLDLNAGTLSGTPPVGSQPSYTISITASNSVGSSTPQTFVLTVIPEATVNFNLSGLGAKMYGNAPFSVASLVTSNSTGAFTFSLGPNSAGCSVTSSGTVSITGVGTCALNVAQAATASYGASPTNPASFVIAQAPLNIPASSGSMVYAGPVPVITPSYSGFQYTDTAASLTTQPICSTTATSASSVGPYATSCIGAADPNYSINYTSGTLTVTQASVSVALSVSLAAASPGTTATLTATLTPQYGGTFSSSVTFYDGATSLGPAPVTGQTAVLVTSALPAGANTFKAVYSGDPNFLIGTSAVSATVNIASVQLDVAPTTVSYPVTAGFLVIVKGSAGTPTGSVTVYDGTKQLMQSPLVIAGATAGLVLPSLNVGVHSLTAVYGGNATYALAGSAAQPVTVNPEPVRLGLNCHAPNFFYGTTLTCTATVGGFTPAQGSVDWIVDGAPQTSALNAQGVATLVITGLAPANHTVTASYPAQGNFAAVPAETATFTIYPDPTTTTLTSSSTNLSSPGPVTLTATVSSPDGAPGTGTVTFYNGKNVIQSVTMTGGVASLTTGTLSNGHYTFTATFAATTDFAGSSSAPLGVVVH